MNVRTARSQVIGGVTAGMGFALMEHTVFDRRTARVGGAKGFGETPDHAGQIALNGSVWVHPGL
jgi:hypothetical protein